MGTAAAVPASRLRGRSPELRSVHDLLESTVTGHGAVLLVEGPPGIGKSRLLSAAEGATHRGFGVAHLDELPRATVPEPLFAGLEMASPAGLQHGGSSDRGDVLAYIGELAVHAAKRAARGPTLITVDDAQCAETTTLEALHTLPVWLAGYPVGWIIARRTGVPDPAVAWLFNELENLGAARTVLGSLSDDAVAQIVTDRLGARPDGDLLAQANLAGGNPQLVGALLEGLHDEGGVAIASGRARLLSGRPSAQVHEVIHDWVARLSPAARHILDLAASLDREFAVEDLAGLLGWAAEDVRRPLDELVAADLISVAGEDVLAFRHDLVRQWVAGHVPAALRRALHGQVTRRRRPHRVRRGWLSLTETERTVAGLVASGLTNREVADRIFLSPHTVSFHLRKVYRKLGIGSRVELTRLSIENERHR